AQQRPLLPPRVHRRIAVLDALRRHVAMGRSKLSPPGVAAAECAASFIVATVASACDRA
ncbi:unnamed protein product, partial [Urochloa humidicola]